MKTESKSTHALRPRTLLFASLCLGLLGLSGCRGKVQHPDAGEGNTIEYCADRKPKENNCMACSSQPGCGWCGTPQDGSAQCQPGTEHDAPSSCQSDWALSTEECAAPPPPPPPPPAPPAPPAAPQETAESQETETEEASSGSEAEEAP